MWKGVNFKAFAILFLKENMCNSSSTCEGEIALECLITTLSVAVTGNMDSVNKFFFQP